MGANPLFDRILSVLRLKKDEPKLTRDQAMSARPVRNPSLQWKENDDGNVVVILPRRDDIAGKLLGWLFMVPQQKPLELDELGTTVWMACDGLNDVGDVVEILAKKYKLNKREVEVSLTEFLRTLGKRGMIGFMVDRAIAEETGVAGQEIVGLENVAKTREEYDAARRKAEEEAAETARIIAEMDAREAREKRESGGDDTEDPIIDQTPLVEIDGELNSGDR